MIHKWKYKDNFNPEDYCGFVYKITNLKTGKFYIGKKSFYHNKKHKLTKKQLAEQVIGRGRRPTHEIIQTESDWKSYWGSNKQLINDVKELGESNFECVILQLCRTKKQLTYWEVHYQCTNNCLTNPDTSYNENILGRFFPKDLV
jgi:hypothetical protein